MVFGLLVTYALGFHYHLFLHLIHGASYSEDHITLRRADTLHVSDLTEYLVSFAWVGDYLATLASCFKGHLTINVACQLLVSSNIVALEYPMVSSGASGLDDHLALYIGCFLF